MLASPVTAPRCLRVLALLLAVAFTGCTDGGDRPEVATSLVDLLPLADLTVETSVIDFGDPASRPAMIRGWDRGKRLHGQSFAWSLGPSSVVTLNIEWRRPLEMKLVGAPFVFAGAPRQDVRVLLNGTDVGTLRMAADATVPKAGFGTTGAREYRLELPAAAQRAGPNSLELRYTYSQRPRDLGLSAKDPRDLAVKWQRLDLGDAAERPAPQARADALLLPAASSVSYYLRQPAGGRLTVGEILPWRDDSAILTVEIARADGAEESSEVVVPKSGVHDFELELPASATPLRLTLRAAGNDRVAGGLRLVAPLVRSPEPALAGKSVSGRSGALGQPNVIVYMVDTLRADHLGCYGYDRPTSPEIDRFAAEATLFTAARAQSPWTRPSVASVFTGVYPQVHGTNGRNHGLSPALQPMAELMFAAGYQTAAVVTNGNVGSEFGFARGFETFDWLPERAGTREVHVLSDQVNLKTFDWLAQRDPNRPFFLYLHTTDPHGPYTPRSPFKERFAPDVIDPELGSNDEILRLGASTDPIPPQVLAQLRGLYDGEVAFNDAAFGELIAKLRELDLYESTIVVLLSDHGEEFDEHGRLGHGHSLFEEMLAIPLIVRFPGDLGRGSKVDTTVGQTDILPTLLDYIGAPVPAAVQGRTLLPLIAEGAMSLDGAGISYALLDMDGREVESVTTAERKLIRYLEYDRPRAPMELFELATDPGEQSDLSAAQPVWTGYLASLLRGTHESWQRIDAPAVEADEELKRRLRAAGYLQ